MFRFILALLSIIACWIWGDWKGWRKYYPTILYFILNDFFYNFLYARFSLWEYYGGYLMNHTFNDIFNAFTLFPCVTMMYIPHFPKGIVKQVLYILFWALLATGIELLSVLLGLFRYLNGWNPGYSFVFDIVALFLLILHYKKPLLTWALTGILILSGAIYTNLPLYNIK